MKRLEGTAFAAIRPYFEQAGRVAEAATCQRAKCGAVIVSGDQIIGDGYNSPAGHDEAQRLCNAEIFFKDKKSNFDDIYGIKKGFALFVTINIRQNTIII